MPHPNDIEPPETCPPDPEEPTEVELREARDEKKIEDLQWLKDQERKFCP